jgi:hypothetical protein
MTKENSKEIRQIDCSEFLKAGLSLGGMNYLLLLACLRRLPLPSNGKPLEISDISSFNPDYISDEFYPRGVDTLYFSPLIVQLTSVVYYGANVQLPPEKKMELNKAISDIMLYLSNIRKEISQYSERALDCFDFGIFLKMLEIIAGKSCLDYATCSSAMKVIVDEIKSEKEDNLAETIDPLKDKFPMEMDFIFSSLNYSVLKWPTMFNPVIAKMKNSKDKWLKAEDMDFEVLRSSARTFSSNHFISRLAKCNALNLSLRHTYSLKKNDGTERKGRLADKLKRTWTLDIDLFYPRAHFQITGGKHIVALICYLVYEVKAEFQIVTDIKPEMLVAMLNEWHCDELKEGDWRAAKSEVIKKFLEELKNRDNYKEKVNDKDIEGWSRLDMSYLVISLEDISLKSSEN